MAADIIGLVCPQCGSKDVTLEGEKTGVCNSCGSRFVVRDVVQTNPDDENKEPEIIIKKFKLAVKRSKEEVMREFLIDAYNDNMPEDFFSSATIKIDETFTEYVKSGVFSNLSYSASSGREHLNNKYNVDWTPITGTKEDFLTVVGFDNKTLEIYSGAIPHDPTRGADIQNLSKEEDEALHLNMNDEFLARLKSAHKWRCEDNLKYVLPGKIEDLHCSISSISKRVYELYLVPTYKIEISYKNNSTSRLIQASNNDRVYFLCFDELIDEKKIVDEKNTETVEEPHSKDAKELCDKAKKSILHSRISIFAFIAALVLWLPIVILALKLPKVMGLALTIPIIVFAVVGVLTSISRSSKFDKKIKYNRKEVEEKLKIRNDNRLVALNKRLGSFSIRELNETEVKELKPNVKIYGRGTYVSIEKDEEEPKLKEIITFPLNKEYNKDSELKYLKSLLAATCNLCFKLGCVTVLVYCATAYSFFTM